MLTGPARKIGLDYVRAIAIGCVLACHFIIHYERFQAVAMVLGVVGVEIFFVLSGYLIGGIFIRTMPQNGEQLSFKTVLHFWGRRWFRTLPLYLCALPVFAWLDGMTRHQFLRYLTFTQNLYSEMPGPFIASWSLSVEEWFYLLLPLLALLFGFVLRDVRRVLLGTTVVMLVVPLALRLSLANHRPWDWVTRKIVVFRLDAIMWGVLAVLLIKSSRFAFLRTRPALVAGTILAAICVARMHARFATGANFETTPLDSLNLTAFSVACAIMLPRLANFPGFHRRADDAAFRLSRASYSIYLGHLPVLYFVSLYAQQHAWMPRGAALGPIALAGIFVVAAVTYHLIERPFLRLRDRLLPELPRAEVNITQPVGLLPREGLTFQAS